MKYFSGAGVRGVLVESGDYEGDIGVGGKFGGVPGYFTADVDIKV